MIEGKYVAKKPAKGRGKSAETSTSEPEATATVDPTSETAVENDAATGEDAVVLPDESAGNDLPASTDNKVTEPEPEPETDDTATSPDEEDSAVSENDTLPEDATDPMPDTARDSDGPPENEHLPDDESPAPVNEEPSEPEPEPEQRQPPVTAEKRSGGMGFLALLLGGVAAGAIGYAVAYFQAGTSPAEDPEIVQQMNDFNDSLLALEERVTEIPDEFNAAPLAEAVNGLEDAQGQITDQLAALSDRIERVERQPNEDGTLAESAVAGFEEEMQALRDQIATLQSNLQGMTDQAMAQLSTTRDEAQAIEENAVAAAQAATRGAALARIQAALETGAPFSPALAELEATLDDSVPDALVAGADEGVPTLAALQADYPPLAREALATARTEGVSGEETGGFGSFLRTQFDVRSVAPQEGDSVDAILSRAEGALREGRLNDTLAELASLPEPARAPLTDWTARAEARVSAVDAATTLSMQSEG